MDEVRTKPTAAQSTALNPAGMTEPWNQGIRGEQVLPLVNSNADTIRCVAGPGSGKTFGLVRRVERILHPRDSPLTAVTFW